jgi:regulator of sirC expression with transglutaminase-like and TPR domain
MKMDTVLRLFNIDQLVTPSVVNALERQEQIDDLHNWYEGHSPLHLFKELAAHELKKAVESTALARMSDVEYAGFRQQWDRLSPAQQRQYLCELAGLPDPERDRGVDI